ncbi:hypothetical protein [Acidiferrobacter thiooxydans]|jgi:hypothetical protein|uniref:Uncharacterized protein n=1 Tax=Acidiferrobacter thiooxydans TaxID=163359 RepID=A0A1C2G4F9_9GAMM|nr:hypothetical protein [Acidiferrobacter thiooxydans]RCN55735.1 hypothetical protein C4900_07365 [Acidiferrobacter thiooxydans]UEO01256.1 hypothetical protein A9R16_007625 [Acidiferrobacter thiooxydans]
MVTTTRHVAIALVLGVLGGAACAQAVTFVPVSRQIRRSDSGWQLAYRQIFEHYSEYAPNGSSSPYGPIADSEHGILRGGALGYRHQGDHLGYGAVAAYTEGTTAYQGFTQDYKTATYTPLMSHTGNDRTEARLWVNYAFALSALPNLAIVPGIMAGDEHWERRTSDGDHETYNAFYAAGRLAFEHAMGPVVLSVSAEAGRLIHPTMTATFAPHQTFALGARQWVGYGIRVTYNIDRDVSVYASYAEDRYQWGQSPIVNGLYEPASHTTLGQASAGVLIRGL